MNEHRRQRKRPTSATDPEESKRDSGIVSGTQGEEPAEHARPRIQAVAANEAERLTKNSSN